MKKVAWMIFSAIYTIDMIAEIVLWAAVLSGAIEMTLLETGCFVISTIVFVVVSMVWGYTVGEKFLNFIDRFINEEEALN